RQDQRGVGHRQDAAPLRAEHDCRRLQGTRRRRAPARARPQARRRRERPASRPDRPRPDRAGRDGPGVLRVDARALAGPREGGARARPRDVDLQVLRHRAEPAPARARGRRRGAGRGRLGRPGLRARRPPPRPRVAPFARQLDRGRDVGDPAEHHREARPRVAGLMALVLSEEQALLQQTARELVAQRAPVSRLRKLRDAGDPDGFSRELWAEMARLGWLGILVPEAHGGAGLGWLELMVVVEELGRTLAPEPLLATVVLGGGALLLGGTDAQRAAHLPAVAAGERLLALAYQEPGSRYDAAPRSTVAERAGGGWRLSGEKRHVLDGHAADAFVVSARTDGGATLFLVARDAPGVTIERQRRVDFRNAAIVRFAGVRVGDDAVVGQPGAGGMLLDRVLDRAAIAV